MRMSAQTESHKLNSKLAINGQKPGPDPYVATLRAVSLEQSASGIWLVRINQGMPMPATDVEVSLWLRLQEALGHGK